MCRAAATLTPLIFGACALVAGPISPAVHGSDLAADVSYKKVARAPHLS
jgi:hypothetical protein